MRISFLFNRHLRAALLISFGFLLPLLPAAAQGWRWAQAAGGSGNDIATGIVADSAGNQYVSGSFEGTASFGSLSLTSSGGSNGFIAKLDSAGSWLWVQQLRYVTVGGFTGGVDRLRLDDRHGALLLVGHAAGVASLGTLALSATGPAEFVARLDAATGAPQWVQRADEVADAGVDPAGNVVVCGTFSGATLTLGSVSAPNTSLVSSAQRDLYVAGLNPAGTWQWIAATGGGHDQYAFELAVDATGAVYVGGRYFGSESGSGDDSVLIGSHFLPYADLAINYAFIAKLSPSRTWLWAKPVVTTHLTDVEGIIVDAQGTVYVAGTTDGPELIFGNDVLLTNIPFTADDVVYVMSLTPQGQPRWANRTGYAQSNLSALMADADGRVFVAGTADGDSVRLGNYLLTPPAGAQGIGFTAVLDSVGRWQWATALEPGLYRASFGLRRHLTAAGAFNGASTTLGSFMLPNPAPSTWQVMVAQRGLPAFIQRFGPTTGPTGTVVTLSGTGFAGTTAVFFGGVPATFTVLPNGQVQVTVPAGLPTGGAGVLIQVVGPNGSSLSTTRFQPRPVGLASTGTESPFFLVPNPTRDRVQLMGLPAGAPPALVLDALGRVVRRQSGPSAALDLRGLPAGVYSVRVGAATRRLVVE